MWKFLLGALAAISSAYALIHFNYLHVATTKDETSSQSTEAASSDGWIGNADKLQSHLNFLADDLLEGRETGARGYDIAALYATNYFRSLGLKPGGGNGSYLQSVPLLKINADYSASQFTIKRGSVENVFQPQEDFVMSGNSAYQESDVSAPIVFVGFGVEAPEFGVNSYEGIDVQGKIVVMLTGGPPNLPAEERAHFGSSSTKAALAASKGAVGVISIYTTAFEQIIPFPRAVQLRARAGMTWTHDDGAAHDAYPQLRVSALIAPDAAQRLFEGAQMSYADVKAAAETGDAPSFDLVGEVAMAQRSTHENVSSSNIAAIMEGSDPALSDEYVVYTAHLDHDGFGPEVDGDSLYNGAVDNASGSAVVLDVARAFAEAKEKPRRSIIFLLVTAEEKGLRGAGYYAHNPTVPIENIVANVNIDGALFFYDFADVIAFGDTHSTMKTHVETAASAMGLGVLPDPYPAQGFFTRSDHYRFVQQGIPSVFTLLGFNATDGSNTGQQAIESYIANKYHQPDDDLSMPFDYEIGAKFVEFQYRLGQSIADADERPVWNEGDFFGDLYGRE